MLRLYYFYHTGRIFTALFILFSIFPAQAIDNYPELLLIRESKVAVLLKQDAQKTRFESSGITLGPDGLYVVFDNLNQMGIFDTALSGKTAQLQSIGGQGGFEGISYSPSNEMFYLVIESLPNGNHYNAHLQTYRKNREMVYAVPLEYDFTHKNKGFEGLSHLAVNNREYLLALCEGNGCEGGKMGSMAGAGLIPVFVWEGGLWLYMKSVQLPPLAGFSDYSALSVYAENQIAVTSQEASLLWLGTLNTATWKIEGTGKIYQFPRNKKGKIKYCNVEGLIQLSDKRFATVTDKYKKDKQPKNCAKHDQSIQLFELP